MPLDVATSLLYAAGFIVSVLFLRGIWILKKSGDARLEQAKQEVKAREGRNPEDAVTYEQEIERQAIAMLKKVPVLRRVFRQF